ncbi:hypothetical protein [Bradyrhizobium diazoefficiens]
MLRIIISGRLRHDFVELNARREQPPVHRRGRRLHGDCGRQLHDFAQRPQRADRRGGSAERAGDHIQIRRLREHQEREVEEVAEQPRDAQSQ